MSRGKASRGWQVTLNNPTEEFLDNIEDVVSGLKGLKYACWAQERGNETGTHHVHIYLLYSNGRYFSTLKNLFPTGHIEAAIAGPGKNRDYVIKVGTQYDDGTSIPGTFREVGELVAGKDDMWGDIWEMLKTGCTPLECVEEYPTAIKWLRQLREAHEEMKQYAIES